MGSGVDYDDRVLVLLRGHVVDRDVLCCGRGTFDGETFVVEDEGGRGAHAVPLDLLDAAMPVTGRLAGWFPNADFYIDNYSVRVSRKPGT